MKGTSTRPGAPQETSASGPASRPASEPASEPPAEPTAASAADFAAGVAALAVSAPSRELLDQLLDKWSLLVIEQLCEQPLRFNELRRKIPAIGQKSLTTTLRRLERNGMAERVVTSTRPLAVEYRIAPLGTTLQELVEGLLGWTTANLPAVERARARFDDEVGSEPHP